MRKQIIIKPHDWDIPNLPTCYNLFGAPTSVPLALSSSFADRLRAVKNLSHPTGTSPSKVEPGDALPSCFSSHAANRCLFHSLFSGTSFCCCFCMFRIFVPFLLAILLLKRSPCPPLYSKTP